MQRLFIIIQYCIPQHMLSRLAGVIADSRWHWLKNFIIEKFIERYQVDMSEALQTDPRSFENFNAFFTRELKPGLRPIIAAPDAIACPADGSISQLGTISSGRIFQAKGQDYSVLELLGGDDEISAKFDGGHFATIYLSPKDYHRVHMPCDGQLQSMTYIPGDLFSVNNATAESVPRLFARNERLVCLFNTEFGPMVVVLVGAMIVAGIETSWAGHIAPRRRQIQTTRYGSAAAQVTLIKGEELGRFKLGSTAIVLFGPEVIQWQSTLGAGSPTKVGECLGRRLSNSEIEPSVTNA